MLAVNIGSPPKLSRPYEAKKTYLKLEFSGTFHNCTVVSNLQWEPQEDL